VVRGIEYTSFSYPKNRLKSNQAQGTQRFSLNRNWLGTELGIGVAEAE
jgi:hypothetical protein